MPMYAHPRKGHLGQPIAAPQIVVSGLVAVGDASETAISLVDDAGETLHSAVINPDGSCELPYAALASAREVVLGPINVGLEADEFRRLVDTDGRLDLAAFLAQSAEPVR
jgi:hypothetical protein